jgi:hypothetical protein
MHSHQLWTGSNFDEFRYVHDNSQSTLVHSHQLWTGSNFDEFRYVHDNSQSTLVHSHQLWTGSNFNELMRVFAIARGNFQSTLMQLLFSFDRGFRVEKTLMHTLASQLSCNSCSRLTRAWELRKLSCNSCSRLTGAWELRKLSLLNSHATLVLVWPGHESWENSHANSRFSTLINSHANSRFSTLD